MGTKPLLAPEYCFAVAKGQRALLAQFSEGLKALEKSGEYRQIYDRWIGVYKEETISLLDAIRYSVIVIIPLILILLVAFIWSWSLRRQVSLKTMALQESLDLFKFVFEAENVGKAQIMRNGEVRANKALADLLGYTVAELRRNRWQDLTYEEDVEAINEIFDQLVSGAKDAARFENRYIHKNGELIWADVSVNTRREETGKPLYHVITIVDISPVLSG